MTIVSPLNLRKVSLLTVFFFISVTTKTKTQTKKQGQKRPLQKSPLSFFFFLNESLSYKLSIYNSHIQTQAVIQHRCTAVAGTRRKDGDNKTFPLPCTKAAASFYPSRRNRINSPTSIPDAALHNCKDNHCAWTVNGLNVCPSWALRLFPDNPKSLCTSSRRIRHIQAEGDIEPLKDTA